MITEEQEQHRRRKENYTLPYGVGLLNGVCVVPDGWIWSELDYDYDEPTSANLRRFWAIKRMGHGL